MNLQELKAKYASTTTATTAAVTTTAAKIDNAVKNSAVKTKEVAVKTGSAFTAALPVSTRKHNDFAAKVNAELNGMTRRLDRHDVLIDVIAEGTGLELPSNETIDQYLDEKARAEQQAAQQAPVVQEDVVASVVSKVLASLGLAQQEASVLSEDTTAFVDQQIEQAPTIEEEAVNEAAAKEQKRMDALAKKEQRRVAALKKKAEQELQQPEEEEEPEVTEEPEVSQEDAPTPKPRKGAGRRRMGRQAPLAAE